MAALNAIALPIAQELKALLEMPPPAETTPLTGTLYEITDHLDALFDTLDLIEDPELKAQAEAEIDEYLGAQVLKVDRMADYLDHLEAQKEKRKKQVALLENANRAGDRITERIKATIERVIRSTGRQSLKGTFYSFTLRKCPDSVDVLDLTLATVPPEYLRITVTESVKKDEAKKAMQAGEEIPGLTLVTDKKSVVRK